MSPALWVPTLWIAILASRPVAQWVYVSAGLTGTVGSNPIDRTILSILMLAGGLVLVHRRFRWGSWARSNVWLVVFFLFCGLSILWSDVPWVSFKRWVRGLGAIGMVLVVLSEPNRRAALATLVRRLGYILIPFSVLLIKYYREYGVRYNEWTGAQMLTGVAVDKNGLGRLCMVVALFVLWEAISRRRGSDDRNSNSPSKRLIDFGLFSGCVYLLLASNSATALVVLISGALVLGILQTRVRFSLSRHLGLTTMAAVVVALLANGVFGLFGVIVGSVGRDVTLTERTLLWPALLDVPGNPILGFGYASFWTGARLMDFSSTFNVGSAHNGYLEIYLDLGIVGLTLYTAFLVSVFLKTKSVLQVHPLFGQIRLVIFVVFALYNITESAATPTTLVFVALLLVVTDYPEGSVSTETQRELAAMKPTPWVRHTPFLQPAGKHVHAGNARSWRTVASRAQGAVQRG